MVTPEDVVRLGHSENHVLWDDHLTLAGDLHTLDVPSLKISNTHLQPHWAGKPLGFSDMY
jgi:hypothetical protein